MGFDCLQRYGRGQRFQRHEITGQPSRVTARGIWVSFARYFHDANDGEFLLTMIKEHCVAHAHRGEVRARGGAADASQGESAALDDFVPAGAEGRELYEPVAR